MVPTLDDLVRTIGIPHSPHMSSELLASVALVSLARSRSLAPQSATATAAAAKHVEEDTRIHTHTAHLHYMRNVTNPAGCVYVCVLCACVNVVVVDVVCEMQKGAF